LYFDLAGHGKRSGLNGLTSEQHQNNNKVGPEKSPQSMETSGTKLVGVFNEATGHFLLRDLEKELMG